MEPGATTVTIYGQEYTVRGVADPEYAQRIAAFVDRRMREVAKASSQVSSVRVAILAALNIADELFRERDAQETSLQRLHETADRLAASLEETVAPSTTNAGAPPSGAGDETAMDPGSEPGLQSGGDALPSA